MAKGGDFERWFAVELSKYWTNSEDAFWRSAGSGGRATARGKKGKFTLGQSGDIVAVDNRGADLTSVISIELKRGYNAVCLWDSLLKPKKKNTFVEWMKQAEKSCLNGNVPWWLLVHKKDRCDPIVYWKDTVTTKAKRTLSVPFSILNPGIVVTFDFGAVCICSATLSDFFTHAVFKGFEEYVADPKRPQFSDTQIRDFSIFAASHDNRRKN